VITLDPSQKSPDAVDRLPVFSPLPNATQIDLAPGQSVLAAIVFSDVVGFSKRMGVDEVATLALLQRDVALLTNLANQHEGQVLKSVGDGLMIFFSSAVQAVRCAQAFQLAVTAESAGRDAAENLQHRIGIHLGDIFLQGTDVMGDGVNIAARLQGEAEPGGICISQTVYDVVRNRLALSVTSLGARELKNIRQAIPIYRILVAANDGAPAPAPAAPQQVRAPVPRWQIAALAGLAGFGAAASWWAFHHASQPQESAASIAPVAPMPPPLRQAYLRKYRFESVIERTTDPVEKEKLRRALDFRNGLIKAIYIRNKEGHPPEQQVGGRNLAILDANPDRLVVRDGEVKRDAAWSELAPEEVVGLAMKMHGDLPRSPLARKHALENLRAFTDLYQLPPPDLRDALADAPRPGRFLPR
jgi:class 3 adenylate cyclase